MITRRLAASRAPEASLLRPERFYGMPHRLAQCASKRWETGTYQKILPSRPERPGFFLRTVFVRRVA